MTIGFILNGEDVTVESNPEKRLIDILRDSFGLLGAKAGCYTGKCGACEVILNEDVVKSCLIPAFKIRGSEIVTIEGFAQTDEYQDIVLGFEQAELETCGFCDTGKILTTEAFLERNKNPLKEDILLAFRGVKCRCTEPEELVNGVIAAYECRKRRLYG